MAKDKKEWRAAGVIITDRSIRSANPEKKIKHGGKMMRELLGPSTEKETDELVAWAKNFYGNKTVNQIRVESGNPNLKPVEGGDVPYWHIIAKWHGRIVKPDLKIV